MYWLRPPVEPNRLEWWDFGTTATHLGRRPDTDWATRPLMAPFIPLKGYANPRGAHRRRRPALAACRGIFVTLTALDDDIAAQERLGAFYDRIRIPQVFDPPGVAGGLEFRQRARLPHAGRPGRSRPGDAGPCVLPRRGGGRLRVGTGQASREWEPAPDAAIETPLFTSLLRPIVPWQWDWFYGEPA